MRWEENKKMSKPFRAGLLAALAASVCAGAWAQSTGDSNLQRTLPRPQQKQPQSTSSLQEPIRNMDQLESVPVHPSDIRIAGVRSVPFQQVSALFRSLLNTDTTVGALNAAAQKVAELYSQHGYALSYAYLPVQDLGTGVVQIVVVEGYIASVSIEGAPPKMARKISQYAEKLKQEKPLTRAGFERYVSLIARLPGIGVDADVQAPDNTDGAAELKLAVHHKGLNTTAAFDANHPGFEGILSATVNGLTPLADQLSASYMAPRGDFDRRYYSMEYAVPLGADGLNLRLSAYRYEGKAGIFYFDDIPLRKHYRDGRGSLMLSYPLRLGVAHTVMLEGGVYGSSSGDLYNIPDDPLRLDLRSNVRAAQLGVSASWKGEQHAAEVNAQLIRSFKGVGAGQLEPVADLVFVKSRLSGSRRDSWGDSNVGTFITATAQHSGRVLPVSEKIVFGGSYFAAAYPSGDASGDSGWAVAAEISKGFQLEKPYLNSVQPYLGVDAQKVRNKGEFAPRGMLRSGVIGVRFDLTPKVNIALSAARPLGVSPLGESGRPWRWNVQGGLSF